MPRRGPRKAVTKTRLGSVARDVFKLEGVAEAQANIEALLKETSEVGPELKKEYMRAAMILVHEAKSVVAFNEKRTEGVHLRDAIFADYGDPRKPNVLVGVDNRRAPHGILIENGTVKMTARPFMRPSVTATRSAMAASIIEGFNRIVARFTK